MFNASNEFLQDGINEFMYDDTEDFIDLTSIIGSNQDKTIESKIYTNPQKVKSIINTFFENSTYNEIQKEWLLEDYEFKNYLIDEIHKRMEKIINDSSTLYFKELVSILALLSLGEKRNIFYSYSKYNKEELEKFFKEYEKLLISTYNNQTIFELNFAHYLMLLETLNEICIINATDLLRKKTINNLIEQMVFSINSLKSTVSLNDTHINKLNILQGKFMLYYTHIPYFNVQNKSPKQIIKEFEFYLERIIDGYLLLDQSVPQKKKSYFQITLLNHASFLILTLLQKIDQTNQHIVLDDLQHIIHELNQHCFLPKQINPKNIEEFKHELLNCFAYIQTHNAETDYMMVLDYFINSQDIGLKSLSVLHNIVLYADNISSKSLYSLVDALLKLPKFKNDLHEHYKLKILDIILLKFIQYNETQLLQKLIDPILSYCNRTNIASELINLYAKIHLDIGLYYSKTNNAISQTQYHYYIYQTINEQYVNNDEYRSQHENLLKNHAYQYLKLLQIDYSSMNTSQLIHIGNTLISKSLPTQELLAKQKLNNYFSNTLKKILSNNDLTHTKVAKLFCEYISEYLFYGLAQIRIIGLGKNIITEDIGYEIMYEDLFSNYKIEYKFPYSYKESFTKIYETNKEFINLNIKNLITTITV